jgi:hypothetical protein
MEDKGAYNRDVINKPDCEKLFRKCGIFNKEIFLMYGVNLCI